MKKLISGTIIITTLVMLIFSMMLIGCKTFTPIIEQNEKVITKTVTEIEKDTVLKTEKDSTYYKAYVKCINDKPVIIKGTVKTSKVETVKVEEISSGVLKPPAVSLNDGELNIFCEKEAERLFFTWREKYEKEHSSDVKTIQLPPKIIEREFTWWEKLWIATGGITTGVLIILLGWKVLKRRFIA